MMALGPNFLSVCQDTLLSGWFSGLGPRWLPISTHCVCFPGEKTGVDKANAEDNGNDGSHIKRVTWNLLFTLYASDFVILVRDIFTLNKIRVILARKKRK